MNRKQDAAPIPMFPGASSRKRKRDLSTYRSAATSSAAKRRAIIARRTIRPVPGLTRVTGYYGRYNVAGGGEKKFFDTAYNGVAFATTGTITTSVNLIPQGVTESTRVGRKCVITSINIKGMILLPSSTDVDNASDIARVIVYLDKQANGAAASVTDILETASFSSYLNLANSQRFKILSNQVFSLNSCAGGYDGTNITSFAVLRDYSFSKKCNLPLEFSNTTGAITELRSNNIGMLLISATTGVGTSLFATARVRFSDN